MEVNPIKIALISDIHGNYPALMAVLEDAKRQQVDTCIFVGDYVFDLAFPNEVTDCIRGMDNAIVIRGNKERYLGQLSQEDSSRWTHDQMGAAYQTYRELTKDNLAYLTHLPDHLVVPLPHHGHIHVCHYVDGLFGAQKKTGCSSSRFRKEMEQAPFTHAQFLDRVENMLSEADAQRIMGQFDASVIVFGHSHLQWHARCMDKLVINPGSCGQPLDCVTMPAYTILEDTEQALRVEERRVPYDLDRTIRYCKQTEIYRQGTIWCELVFLAMRTGADHFAEFFSLAQGLAEKEADTHPFFHNDVWRAAHKAFHDKRAAPR